MVPFTSRVARGGSRADADVAAAGGERVPAIRVGEISAIPRRAVVEARDAIGRAARGRGCATPAAAAVVLEVKP